MSVTKKIRGAKKKGCGSREEVPSGGVVLRRKKPSLSRKKLPKRGEHRCHGARCGKRRSSAMVKRGKLCEEEEEKLVVETDLLRQSDLPGVDEYYLGEP